MSGGPILALDIATRMGWAYGRPGEVPISGSVRLAPPGSSHGAIGRGYLRWFTDFLKLSPVEALYYEQPLDPAFSIRKDGTRSSTFATARLLLGLPLLVETLAEAKGIFRIREAAVGDVRGEFIHKTRMKGPDAKLMVQAKCRHFGWKFDDDNAADALAVWFFAGVCEVKDPIVRLGAGPLFDGEPAPAPPRAVPIDTAPMAAMSKDAARKLAASVFKSGAVRVSNLKIPAAKPDVYSDVEDIDP